MTPWNLARAIGLAAALGLAVPALSACGEDPAEEEIGEAGEETGEALEEGAEQTGETMDEAGDEMEDAAD